MTGLLAGAVLALAAALLVVHDVKVQFRRAVQEACRHAYRQTFDRVTITGTTHPRPVLDGLRPDFVVIDEVVAFPPEVWEQARAALIERETHFLHGRFGRPPGTERFYGVDVIRHPGIPPDKIYLLRPDALIHQPIHPTKENP